MNTTVKEKLTQHAKMLFAEMGIPENDFCIQHESPEVTIFGGTNRLIANLEHDYSGYQFHIDRTLSLKERVEIWDNDILEEKKFLKLDKNYSLVTSEIFDQFLRSVLDTKSIDDLLEIPGIYGILAEHFNNEVLEAWEESYPELVFGAWD
jgi:hypothetical protein